MPELVKETLRTWFADEKSIFEAVSDIAGDRTRPELLASALRFVGHSVGGYVLVSALLKCLDAAVSLLQTSPHPYMLALSALQASIMLYATTKIGKIAEYLSSIHGKMNTTRPMTNETDPATAPHRAPEQEGPE